MPTQIDDLVRICTKNIFLIVRVRKPKKKDMFFYNILTTIIMLLIIYCSIVNLRTKSKDEIFSRIFINHFSRQNFSKWNVNLKNIKTIIKGYLLAVAQGHRDNTIKAIVLYFILDFDFISKDFHFVSHYLIKKLC